MGAVTHRLRTNVNALLHGDGYQASRPLEDTQEHVGHRKDALGFLLSLSARQLEDFSDGAPRDEGKDTIQEPGAAIIIDPL